MFVEEVFIKRNLKRFVCTDRLDILLEYLNKFVSSDVGYEFNLFSYPKLIEFVKEQEMQLE